MKIHLTMFDQSIDMPYESRERLIIKNGLDWLGLKLPSPDSGYLMFENND